MKNLKKRSPNVLYSLARRFAGFFLTLKEILSSVIMMLMVALARIKFIHKIMRYLVKKVPFLRNLKRPLSAINSRGVIRWQELTNYAAYVLNRYPRLKKIILRFLVLIMPKVFVRPLEISQLLSIKIIMAVSAADENEKQQITFLELK